MEHARPAHIRWDIDFRGMSGRAKRIARQIRESSPRIVELRIEGEMGISELPAIYAEIHKCDAKIVATVRLFPGVSELAQRGYVMDFLWWVDAHQPFRGEVPPGAKAISMTVDEDSLPHFPDLLEEFAGSDVQELHLPNVNAVRALAEVGHVPLPQPGELLEAAGAVSRRQIPLTRKRLVVHDFFLWKHLRDVFPREAAESVEFSECRAASALAHVDWEGNVYPCDSLPIRLGNLQDRTFERIWRSPARMQILDTIRAIPDACGPCDQAPGCLSVCRGLLRDVPGAGRTGRAERPADGQN